MKYTPKQIDEEISNGESDTFSGFLKIVTTLVVIIIVSFFALNKLLSAFILNISVEDEQNIFGFVSYSGKNEKTFNEDKINQIKNNLIGDERFRSFIKIKLLCDEEKNAYSLPGGQILISSALIELVDSENALATIIAHEIGHIYHRHHLKNLSFQLTWKVLMSMLTIVDQSSVIDLFSYLHSLSYSREAERQADQYAKKAIVNYYGHLVGSNDFFQKIMNDDGDSISFLSTHPSHSERIDYFKNEEKGKPIELNKKQILSDCTNSKDN